MKALKPLIGTLFICISFIVFAEEETTASDIEIETHGFIRADYGNGDRYPQEDGEDLFGISRSALITKAKYENITGVFVIGAELLTGSTQNQVNSGDIGIKDAFIVIDKLADGNLSVSVGAQPLLFGLKPNGYPADRSIQGSIEYGATGAFAVSNQAGPSIITDYNLGKSGKLHFALFDSNNAYTNDSGSTAGSTLTDNFLIQYSIGNLLNDRLSLNVGYESLTGTDNNSNSILTIGAGYKFGQFEISLEHFNIDSNIVGTTSDESYLVAELSYLSANDTLIYLDFSQADQINTDTFRLGGVIPYNKLLSFMIEYSNDSIDTGNDVSSIDFRAIVSF